MKHQFKIDIFEGPLDLLLHFIKEQKMDIYDIPIASITEQYMEYLELMRDLNLDVAGDYLILAAELTRIKSRMLLPSQEPEDPEEGQDPREELTRRLLEYQKYKAAAVDLRKREYDRQQVLSRSVPPEFEDEDDAVLADVSVFDLINAFQKVLKDRSLRADYEITISALSVSDRINFILEMLNEAESITFESLFSALNIKEEIVVTFLALLELMRLRLVKASQVGNFEPIRLYTVADKETQDEIMQEYNAEQSSNQGNETVE